MAWTSKEASLIVAGNDLGSSYFSSPCQYLLDLQFVRNGSPLSCFSHKLI